MGMNVDLARWAVKGHQDALMFLAHIHDIAHIADDIADGDTDDAMRSTETLLALTLVTLPNNPFYREFFARLNPLVANAVTHWAAANLFERNRDAQYLDRAFVIRSMYATLTIACADIVAGAADAGEWARQVAHRVWSEWTEESVGGYVAEHMQTGNLAGLDPKPGLNDE